MDQIFKSRKKQSAFNCTFCGSSLGIKKLDNTIFTEVLEEVKENTETIAYNSEAISDRTKLLIGYFDILKFHKQLIKRKLC